MEQEKEFSEELEAWLRSDGPKTFGGLNEVFGEKTFAVTILMLMFVSALPIPTGGLTNLFEALAILVALQMVFMRRTIWLPKRWMRRELGATTTEKAIPFIVRRIRYFERFSRPRMTFLFTQRIFEPFLGVLIIVFTLGSFFAPPFSGLDTLPALGVVVIALAIILEDVVVLAVGVAIGTGGVILVITLGAAAVRFFQRLF